MACFNIYLEDELPPVSFDLDQCDTERFVGFMERCKKAIQIADEAMFELLSSSCIGIPEPGEPLILADEDGAEVQMLDLASAAITDAVEWLQPRGYIDVIADQQGDEHIVVLGCPE